MDCSKTEVFLSELKRMCKGVGGCYKCKIYHLLESPRLCIDGGGAFAKKPTECIAIVQEWSDKHPVKTRLSVLKEHYPNARMAPNGAPHACVKNLYNIECPYKGKDINDEVCLQCWNTPIEDGE